MNKICRAKAVTSTFLLLLVLIIAVVALFIYVLSRPRVIYREVVMPSKEIVQEKEPSKEVTKGEFPKGMLYEPPKREGLALRLVGTSGYRKEYIAYIEDLTTFTTGEYRVGDIISEAQIIKISSGKVVLLHDGKRTVLTLEGGGYKFADPDAWIDIISEENFIVSKVKLAQKAQNVNQLLTEAIPVPHISGGKIKGFSLQSLKKDGILSEAGFREGDIIKSVNDEKLDNIKKPLDVYEGLRSLVNQEQDPLIKVEIRRGNKTHTFTYRILNSQ
ncbi:MAG: hypothetical protein JSW40_01640 [Candidatus Omnitrophota bacterium]|nr:MAG: hypothetical protein JSW40_01640 [Candidatus Omnitrophota bacterium]